jgi:hypothetical protein
MGRAGRAATADRRRAATSSARQPLRWIAAAIVSARARISSAVVVNMRWTGTVAAARPAAYSASVPSSAA